MKKRRVVSLAISIILVMGLLSGCSLFNKDIPEDLSHRPTVDDISESGAYVLTSTSGSIILFNENNEPISSFNLDSNKKSDYIYTVDNGSVYAAELINDPVQNQIIYAIDKGNNKAYMLSVKNDEIKEIASKSVKDSEIDEIHAYNGTLYYSVYAERRAANKFTYAKPESVKNNGVVEYNAKLPEPLPSKTYTYIVSINFIDEFLKEMDYTGLSAYSKSNIKLGIDKGSNTFQIPCEVNTWNVDDNYIYFSYESRIGAYNMEKDQIGLYYGPVETMDSGIQDGLNGSVYMLSGFGKDATKSVILDLNQGDMNVKNIIEIEDEPEPMLISVDKSGVIFVVTKKNDPTVFAKLKVYNANTMQLTASVPLSYVPTQLVSHNGIAYMLNENEDYFLSYDGKIYEHNKVNNEINYSGILSVNNFRLDKYEYNEDGHYVNSDGIEMLADGTLINNKNERINRYFQKIDEYGRAINEDGQLIDRYNNIIDENGNIIEYTIGSDGFYKDSKGNYVNEDGVKLVQDEDGNWIDPTIIEDEDPIPGHYDENGEFIVDAEYLETHPDAYEKLDNADEE